MNRSNEIVRTEQPNTHTRNPARVNPGSNWNEEHHMAFVQGIAGGLFRTKQIRI